MRMIRMGAVAAVAVSMLVAATGCKSSMHDQNLALHQQNRELQDQLRQREAERDQRPDASALSAKDAEIAARDAKLAELENQLREPAPAQAGLPANDRASPNRDELQQATGEMTVNLPGESSSTPDAPRSGTARATLNKVAAAIKRNTRARRFS